MWRFSGAYFETYYVAFLWEFEFRPLFNMGEDSPLLVKNPKIATVFYDMAYYSYHANHVFHIISFCP